MKVKELIEQLRLCDQDAEVVMESQGSWTNIETVHISNSGKMLVELLVLGCGYFLLDMEFYDVELF